MKTRTVATGNASANAPSPASAKTTHSAIRTDATTVAISHAASARSPDCGVRIADCGADDGMLLIFFPCARPERDETSLAPRRVRNPNSAIRNCCVSFRVEDERAAYLLERASRPAPTRMHGVDARLVLACERRVGVEDEAVVVVLRVNFCGKVRARPGSEGGPRRPSRHRKMHPRPAVRLSAGNDPAT